MNKGLYRESLGVNLPRFLTSVKLPQKVMTPILEAVVNSLQSIAERGNSNGYVRVELVREPNDGYLDKNTPSDINCVRIIDNGIGFNQSNFDSFRSIASDYKSKQGGKGMGRLTWLKVFDQVNVVSSYEDNCELRQIQFDFTENGIAQNLLGSSIDNQKTIITFSSVKKNYSKSLHLLSLDNIARNIFIHNVWEFLFNKSMPTVLVVDGKDEINVNELYRELFIDEPVSESHKVLKYDFTITHVRLKSHKEFTNLMAYAANDRVVEEYRIDDQIRGMKSILYDNGMPFTYLGCVTSDMFDDNVDCCRTKVFNDDDDLFLTCSLTHDVLFTNAIKWVEDYLQPYLQSNIEEMETKIREYVDRSDLKYKPILQLLLPNINITCDANDKDIAIALAREYSVQEQRLKDDIPSLKAEEGESLSQYTSRVHDLLNRLQNFTCSQLAAYVIHRKAILEYLERAVSLSFNDHYEKESLIHKTILPMHKDKFTLHDNNLWIISEELIYKDYIASDLPISKSQYCESQSQDRPDIQLVNFYDQAYVVRDKNNAVAEITIVEFKRPMRDDYTEDNNPIIQVINYIKAIRAGLRKDFKGRPVVNSENTPAFCYIVCDLTPTLVEIAKGRDYWFNANNTGAFGFQKTLSMYIEIISYDLLIERAKKRHVAFFNKLGLS